MSDTKKPRQPHPGTRARRYRCFLPDLAGFTGARRERTDATRLVYRVARGRAAWPPSTLAAGAAYFAQYCVCASPPDTASYTAS